MDFRQAPTRNVKVKLSLIGTLSVTVYSSRGYTFFFARRTTGEASDLSGRISTVCRPNTTPEVGGVTQVEMRSERRYDMVQRTTRVRDPRQVSGESVLVSTWYVRSLVGSPSPTISWWRQDKKSSEKMVVETKAKVGIIQAFALSQCTLLKGTFPAGLPQRTRLPDQ